MDETLRKIEALLFLAGEAVSFKELGQLIGQGPEAAREAVGRLRGELAEHGLTVIHSDTHAQLTTSTLVTEYLQQFLRGEAQHLSTAAAETLAIIAYRGPITRVEVESIRGVDCRRMVRQLIARGLIRRHSVMGSLPRYSITEEFLQFLGLSQREDLPDFDQLASHEKIEQLLKSAE